MTEPSRVTGDRVKQLRRAKGWSARRLAEECERLGADWVTDNVIENIERSGSSKRARRDVTVDELLVFAYALGVPPLALLVPADGLVQAAPAEPGLDPAALTWWIDGLEASGQGGAAFAREAAPLATYRRLHAMIASARNADRVWRAAGSPANGAMADGRHSALQGLAAMLDPILRVGIQPSGVPGAWIDEMAARGWLDPHATVGGHDGQGH